MNSSFSEILNPIAKLILLNAEGTSEKVFVFNGPKYVKSFQLYVHLKHSLLQLMGRTIEKQHFFSYNNRKVAEPLDTIQLQVKSFYV